MMDETTTTTINNSSSSTTSSTLTTPSPMIITIEDDFLNDPLELISTSSSSSSVPTTPLTAFQRFESTRRSLNNNNNNNIQRDYSGGDYHHSDHSNSSTLFVQHENIQKKAFTKWLNSYLAKKNYPLINDLFIDLRDGTTLIALLDVLCNCKIKLERGKLRVHHINNVIRALQVFSEKCQIKLVNISSNDIVDGNRKITLGLVWRIILHCQVNNILRNTSNTGPLNPVQKLIAVDPKLQQNISSSNKDQQQQQKLRTTNIPISTSGVYNNKLQQQQQQQITATTPTAIQQNPITLKYLNNNNFKTAIQQQTPIKKSNANSLQQQPQQPTSAKMSQNDLEKALLSWCRQCTENYEGVKITNFTTSWNDGLAFNALIHHFRPKLFNYGEILALDPEDRLKNAFDLAYKHLNIDKLLDPEDVNTPRPDKKSVMMYVMCFFQVLQNTTPQNLTENENSEMESVKTSISGTKRSDSFRKHSQSIPNQSKLPKLSPQESSTTAITAEKKVKQNVLMSPASTKPSNIPISSPIVSRKFPNVSQNNHNNNVAASGNSKSSFKNHIDDLLTDYHTEMEDMLMKIMIIEEKLKEKQILDEEQFKKAQFDLQIDNFSNASSSQSSQQQLKGTSTILKQIITTNEAAEYSKMRFTEHEELMTELTRFSGKILQLMERGKNYLAQFQSFNESTVDEQKKYELAMDMNLLNENFNKIRVKATDYQHFLQNMLKQAQYKQIDGLKLSMIQIEERISILIPEKYDQIPFSLQSLKEQLRQFEELQDSMNKEQELLKTISNFFIIEQDDQKDGAGDLYDRLEALNERWVNICKITESRGEFLRKLYATWTEFEEEKCRLFDWLKRLDNRLTDFESYNEEILSKSYATKPDLKFLKESLKRLDRMRSEVVFGPEKLHLKTDDGDKDGVIGDNKNTNIDSELKKTVTTKFIELTYALVNLDSAGDSKLSQKTLQANRDFGQQWDLLLGRIEQLETNIRNRLKLFPECWLDEYEKNSKKIQSKPQSLIPQAGKVSGLKQFDEQIEKIPLLTSPISGKSKSESEPDWRKDIEPIKHVIKKYEESLNKLSSAKPLHNLDEYDLEEFEIPTTHCLHSNFRSYWWQSNRSTKSFEKRFLVDVDSIDVQKEQTKLDNLDDEIKNHHYDKSIKSMEQYIETNNNILGGDLADLEEIKSIQQSWKSLINNLNDSKRRNFVALELFQIYEKNLSKAEMVHEEYFQELDKFYKTKLQKSTSVDDCSNNNNDIERIIKICEKCVMDISEDHEIYKEKLIKLRSIIPQLFLTWPYKISDTGEPFKFIWQKYKFKPSTLLTTLQLHCFNWSFKIYIFYERMYLLYSLANILRVELSMRPSLLFSSNPMNTKSITEVDNSLTNDNNKFNDDDIIIVDNKKQDIENIKADKVMVVIEKFESVLTHMLQCLNEYEGDDDDDEDYEGDYESTNGADEENNSNNDSMMLIKRQLKNGNDQKTVTTTTATTNSDQYPGSQLCSFADLANAIDKRIYVLCYLQKTMIDEEKEYIFACKCAAEYIFKPNDNEFDEKNMADIETLLKSLNADDFDEKTAKMIRSIQLSIENWSKMVNIFKTLLPQLTEISPSITVLETEFSQLLKFVESSDDFLDEPVAIGDSESLQCQLTECSRLKNYMQGTAEENLQKIMDIAQKALQLLFGTDVYCDCVPVIKYIKETWHSLCDRILNKLERLKLAEQLTLNLIERLDYYKQELNSIEQLVNQPLAMDERLRTVQIPKWKNKNLQKATTTKAIQINNQSIYNLPKFLLEILNELKSNYNEEIISTSDDSIISKMEQFTKSTNNTNKTNNTLAFEQLREVAKKDLPNRFDQLEKTLKPGSELFEEFLKSLLEMDKFMKTIKEHHQKCEQYELLIKNHSNIEDLEDAVNYLDQIEECLTQLNNHKQNQNLQSLEKIWKGKKFLDYVQTVFPSVSQLLDKNQLEFMNIRQNEIELGKNLTKILNTLKKFIHDCTEADQYICSMKKWIQEFHQKLDSTDSSVSTKFIDKQSHWLLLETKRKEMSTLENLFSSKFKLAGFNRAAERLENKVQFVQQLFDELISRKEKLFQINEQPSSKKTFLGSNLTSSDSARKPKLDLNTRINSAEKHLADLGSLISEMEIDFGDEVTNEQNIPIILQQMIETNCAEYQKQLSNLDVEINHLKKSPEVIMNSKLKERLTNLEQTIEALDESLRYRIDILKYLSELCNEINDNLLLLEQEAEKVELDSTDLSNEEQEQQQLQQIKQNCRQVFSKICNLKENLDISCIKHSDILIGIEEIGSCYDELITMVAEHYLLLDEDEDHDDDDDNYDLDFSNEMNQTVIMMEPTSSRKHNNTQIPFERKFLPKITEENNSNDGDRQSKSTSISSPLLKNEEEKEEEGQSKRQLLIKNNNKIYKFIIDEKNRMKTIIKNKHELEKLLFDEEFPHPNQTYSFQSYLISLKLLEINIDRIGQRKIPELMHYRHENVNNMFLFMLEAELFFLNKSLNEIRIHLEQILCASIITGLRLPMSMNIKQNFIEPVCPVHQLFKIDSIKSSNTNYDQVKILDPHTIQFNFNPLLNDWSKKILNKNDLDRIICQVLKQYNLLENNFNNSNGIFLSLHRHLKLIHEDTIQFNMEIRRLFDWFENVELQINNGRITLVSADPNRLEETDLNLHVVACTQSLLVTQLRTHVPIYSRLNVIYKRILHHFSPEINEKFRHYSFDFQALLEAKNRIKHEMNKVKRKWNSIVHELTWRRQCLIDLATCKPNVTVNGRPYYRGQDKDFDHLIHESVKNEFIDFNCSIEEYDDLFLVNQLRTWIQNTNHKLDYYLKEFKLNDSDIESSINLHNKLKLLQQDMAKQFMNWMLLTQEPFIKLLNIAKLSIDDRQLLNDQFELISIRLYNLGYFVDEFITTCSNISQLIKNELEWLLMAHEHLQVIDDYLGESSPILRKEIDIIMKQQQQQPQNETKSSPVQEFPTDSLAFMENIKNTLINHERSIKQIAVLFEELQQDSKNYSFENYETENLTKQFEQIKELYFNLVEQLRRYGLTIWSSIHYLFKYVLGYSQQYRRQKYKLQQQQQAMLLKNNNNNTNNNINISQTNNNNSLRSIDSERSSRLQQQHHYNNNTNAIQVWECNPNILKQYYQIANIELRRWISFETYILSLFIEKSLKTIRLTSEQSIMDNNNTSKIIEFTIKRCEDFLTELDFSVTILKQLWLQLSSQQSLVTESDNGNVFKTNPQQFIPSTPTPSPLPTTTTKTVTTTKTKSISKNEKPSTPDSITATSSTKQSSSSISSSFKNPLSIKLNRAQSTTTSNVKTIINNNNQNNSNNNNNNNNDNQSFDLKRFHSLGPGRRTRPSTTTATTPTTTPNTPTAINKIIQSNKNTATSDRIINNSNNNNNKNIILVDVHDQKTNIENNLNDIEDNQKQKLPSNCDYQSLFITQQLYPPDFNYFKSIQLEIMERIRDIQREQHQRSIQNLIQNIKQRQQQQQQQRNNNNLMANDDNLYDTVADNNQSSMDDSYYSRPSDLQEINQNNLDMQRLDIEQWLDSMEQKLSQITIQQQQLTNCSNIDSTIIPSSSTQSTNTTTNVSSSSSSRINRKHDPSSSTSNILEQQELKNQLEILLDYENECNQYGSRLQMLCNSIDARIASLKPPAPKPLPSTSSSNSTHITNGNNSINGAGGGATGSTTKSNNNIISMPYYDHLIKLRKQASDMQCRSNYLFLCIKCKTRSLNELLSITSSSQNRNLIMSMVNGSMSGSDLTDYYGSSASPSTQKSQKSSKLSSTTAMIMKTGSGSMIGHDSAINSTTTAPSTAGTSTGNTSINSIGGASSVLGTVPSTNNNNSGSNNILGNNSNNNSNVISQQQPQQQQNNYSLHEQSEKRFIKWLIEMEHSLDFIEKGLAAESALINNDGSITNFNSDDGALYSNVSEMQQMHMNYYEKIKIIQREIEQKRTDHRLLMELVDNSNNNINDSSDSSSIFNKSRNIDQQQHGSATSPTFGSSNKNNKIIDPWFQRFRNRVDQLNGRWNSVRLRVLTLRSRLESSSLIHKNNTSCPNTTHSTSMYSVNSGVSGLVAAGVAGTAAVAAPQPMMDDPYSIYSISAFNAVVSERHSQLMLSLRELTEWIIKRQMDYQQIPQIPDTHQQQQHQQSYVPMDMASVMQQKSSLILLRNQLIEKRPIIDNSLLACHNFLRRLGVKRAQDIKLNQAKLSASTSMVSSLTGGTVVTAINNNNNTTNNDTQQQQIQLKQHQKQQSDLENIELTLNREMNKLLELWHSIQSTVDMGLQRLDEAHLRLTDLQRVMDDLGAKLHESEIVKSKWTPVQQIQFDELAQHRSQLKTFQQTYVAPVSRDVILVNEIAARLTGRNVPISHENLKSLEEVTMRARLLRMAVDERSKELDQVIREHNRAQQHFLTEAVEEPWERAVTTNKLPCYINHKTETVHTLSPRYQEIIQSMNKFNDVRYAVYRTAMKLRYLQQQLGLDQVSLENLINAFDQHCLGPNFNGSAASNQKLQSNEDSSNTTQSNITITNNSNNDRQLEDVNNEELPYELRLISVQNIVSCLKMIFETAESERIQFENKSVNSTNSGSSGSGNSKSSKQQQQQSSSSSRKESNATTTGSIKSQNNEQQQQQNKNDQKNEDVTSLNGGINVPLYVDLCLNWLLDLYDTPSRTGFIRQFSFQVAMVLLSRISLEQKYIYLFGLIANENRTTDERRFGLLIYDCLRLPKLLGEVAAFGGTNVEPSVRSCLEMAGNPPNGLTVEHVLNWIRAEPQSLVWVVVIHRLRLAERSRHPAKCNSCKLFPIVGFRYRCLKCFNFDLCQQCFLLDKIVKKHKPSHPMQEYCVATTTGEDLKDFGKILRNKFKSGRYFKRHQELGYLPVQSLHEGDRIDESAPSFVHTLQGSYSHAPSSNTTPVHTLSYPQRAASPSSMTRRDMDFIGMDPSSSHQRQQQQFQQQQQQYNAGIYGTRPINTGRKFQTSIEHHSPQTSISGMNQSPSKRLILNSNNNIESNNQIINNNNNDNQSKDDVHQRLSNYAQRLAEAEINEQQNPTTMIYQQQHPHQFPRSESSRGSISSSSITRSSSQQHHLQQQQHHPQQQNYYSNRNKFDSLPPTMMEQQNHQNLYHQPRPPFNHHSYHRRGGSFGGNQQNIDDNNIHNSNKNPMYDVIQSPTEMLSKIAADQRNELEIIIQRLQEENRLLMNEYAQLKSEKQNKSNKTPNSNDLSSSNQLKSSNKIESASNSNESKQLDESKSELDNKLIKSDDKSTTINGNITSSLQNSDETNLQTTSNINKHSKINENIPQYLLDEAKRLTNNKQRLENRTNELEKCNKLLESQLEAFQYYINNTGSLNQDAKQKLESRINKTKKLLEQEQKQQQKSKSIKNSGNIRNEIIKFDDDQDEDYENSINDTDNDNNDDDLEILESSKMSSSSNSTIEKILTRHHTDNTKTSISSSIQYQQPLLHTAADRINQAVGGLVDVFNNQDSEEQSEADSSSNLKKQSNITTVSRL